MKYLKLNSTTISVDELVGIGVGEQLPQDSRDPSVPYIIVYYKDVQPIIIYYATKDQRDFDYNYVVNYLVPVAKLVDKQNKA